MRKLSPAHVDATLVRIDWYRLNFPEIERDPEKWKATIESETQAYEDIDALTHLALEDGAMVQILEARARRLKERQRHTKGYIMQLMAKIGLLKHEMPIATLSVSMRTNLQIIDDARVPPEYWVLSLNPEKVEKDLRAGIDVPGAELVQGQPTLTIRKD
jgi:hypothetical protein